MIRLTIKNYRCFSAPAKIDFDEGFTAFVGVNNAGKSALIRFLVEFRSLFQSLQNVDAMTRSLSAGAGSVQLQHVLDPEEAFSNLNERPIELEIDFLNESSNKSDNAITKLAITIRRNLVWETRIHTSNGVRTFQRGLGWSNLHIIDPGGPPPLDYSPVMELARTLSDTLYIGPFRNIINVGANTTYFDIQIGDAFVSQFRDLKTGPNKRNSAGIQRLIEDVKKIFEFDSLSIEPSNDLKSLHITVNGKPFKQHELGSGLSQFIVVLANAAIKKPSIILIDEPELSLHPRLQLDFLTALGRYASKGVWFSTHSLGLARSAAERVYAVHRVSDGNSIVTPLEGTPRAAEFLGELNFSTQKELGADKILFVEGPTEVKVVQQLLRFMGKDHRLILLPMYGNLLDRVQLEEVMRITTKIAALIDSEKDAEDATVEPKRAAFLEMFQAKGLEVHVLERRATENYFTDEAVKQVFGQNFRALSHFEKLKDAQPHWSKNNNWLLAGPSAQAINESDLGRFLAKL